MSVCFRHQRIPGRTSRALGHIPQSLPSSSQLCLSLVFVFTLDFVPALVVVVVVAAAAVVVVVGVVVDRVWKLKFSCGLQPPSQIIDNIQKWKASTRTTTIFLSLTNREHDAENFSVFSTVTSSVSISLVMLIVSSPPSYTFLVSQRHQMG